MIASLCFNNSCNFSRGNKLTDNNISKLTIRHISSMIASREISCLEVVDAIIEKIEKLNPTFNSFITVLDECARKQAKQADSLLKEGKYLGPLHGIPISLKDLIYIKGVKSTSGSKILADFVPDYDSTITRRLREAGAVIVGTNNLHEFASGITGINPHYGPSRNPWDIARMSGGSSGGSAVAVSSGMSFASIGTDTSGSIRVPSSLCGIFGLQPTYGRVSKHGVMPLAPSIDHVGPLAKSAWDIAAILGVIAGHDDRDNSSVNLPVPDYLKEITSSPFSSPTPELRNTNHNISGKKFKIGIPKQFFFELIEPKVMKVFEEFVDKLHGCGIITTKTSIELEGTDKIVETWRAIRLSEAASIHSEWMISRAQDYGNDVIRMLEKGLEVRAVKYLNALHKWRQQIRDAFLRTISPYDALLVPTTIIPAPFLDQKTVNIDGNSIEVYFALSRLTNVFNITGLPALNIPAGVIDSRLPIGVQLVGRPFDEARILKIAYTYEQNYNLLEEFSAPILQ
jgi:aspartyl-tRNA(Asn)/glutamyl-tRNA(Gln) amidotransferase subunit A